MKTYTIDEETYNDLLKVLDSNTKEKLEMNTIANREWSNLMLERLIACFPDEEFLKADGFDEAVIGVDSKLQRLIYSTSKCMEILERSMTHEEAVEYFYFNTESCYVGENTPIWCMDEEL